MSELARWSYTGKATFWKRLEGQNDYGDPLGFAAPVVIDCGYEGGLSKRLGDIGAERVVKNTFWTEYALADTGDYILIGISTEPDPLVAGADEVMQAVRFEDTFDRLVDDWAIITGA
ncbi:MULTISPECIES: hypothetical protein [Cronobacter]|uniref:hypothetical protein n=1 Tax=Cronobacter TaxID=413496 RepID=UPI00029B9E59|nr:MULTISPECIES: hypothetical protein [Cronobacter]ELY4445672.1 hypothetical protein [Cronobacter malonaticus]CCJ94890.1 hypothetical protein BN131_2563 [Cronobacter malonaticus 681]ALX78366.1 hypothetical protein AFK66_022140 [Cronobacter malonaticus LMG 23826]EKY2044605.1 hypothetical protein [Cronobacter sakazakii]EKY2084503.1 hypothetical protein [Cronobacter sakazakii]